VRIVHASASVKKQYGCEDPIHQGFSPKARETATGISEKAKLEADLKLESLDKQFKGVADQWNLHPSPEWRATWIRLAEKLGDTVPNAKRVLALAGVEFAETKETE